MNQLEAIYREALENICKTLDGCGMRQDEEMPLSELLLLRVAREALSAQGEQETPTDFRNAGNTNFNRPNGRPEPPTCPKCGRYECTSTDLTGLCGDGTYFDPEMPPIKCQVVNVTLPAPQEPPNPAVGQATSVMAEGMVYKKGDSSKSPSDPFVNLEPKSTETQERCPKCKTEVEWVVPPIPGVKPFFQCQDPDCNWMSDDDFPERKSI